MRYIIGNCKFLLTCYNNHVCIPGSSVTANMPVLGTGDSGFESRLPDINNTITKKINT